MRAPKKARVDHDSNLPAFDAWVMREWIAEGKLTDELLEMFTLQQRLTRLELALAAL